MFAAFVRRRRRTELDYPEGIWIDVGTVYMETLLPSLREGEPEVHGMLDGNWKLVARPSAEDWQLYDIEADPGEKIDLSRAEAHRLARMRKELEAVLSSKGTEDSALPVEMDDEIAEKLEALGYLSQE